MPPTAIHSRAVLTTYTAVLGTGCCIYFSIANSSRLTVALMVCFSVCCNAVSADRIRRLLNKVGGKGIDVGYPIFTSAVKTFSKFLNYLYCIYIISYLLTITSQVMRILFQKTRIIISYWLTYSLSLFLTAYTSSRHIIYHIISYIVHFMNFVQVALTILLLRELSWMLLNWIYLCFTYLLSCLTDTIHGLCC